MEKIKLNNQVVRMRKHVKQAKVHSINRLAKQVKLLQNRKGDEIRVMKAKRKAERYIQEISLLKKIKPDCVSKLALSKTKDWKKVLSQKNSTLEDRCFAVLASYGPVQKEVELFHNSNKDIVSKISDFLKQWENKSKFSRDSTQEKKSNVKNNSTGLKTKAKEDLLNITNQSESADNTNNESLNDKTNITPSIENNCDLKRKEKKSEVFLKQKLSTLIKPSQDSFLTDSECNKFNSEHVEENRMEVKMSDETEKMPKIVLNNDSRNELEMQLIDSNVDSETKISYKRSNKNKTENESDVESDESENENSDLEIFPENGPKTEYTEIKDTDDKKSKMLLHSKYDSDCAGIKKNPIAENKTTCSISMKTDNIGSKSVENKLKAIAMINLDDFKDLDEIPVDNSVENTGLSEEEEGTSEDSSNKIPENDPFFLGHDEAVSTENKLVDGLKSNNFVSLNEIFERKEKSNNDYNYTKNFHSSRFPSKYSPESKSEKNFKTWKKDKGVYNHQQDRFQFKRKGNFDSEDTKYKHQSFKHKRFDRYIKNKKEFNQKANLQTHGYVKQKYSNDLDNRNNNFSGNSKDVHKKSDATSKPLHPSWEAKRKQKEMTNISFQGKKIVFDD